MKTATQKWVCVAVWFIRKKRLLFVQIGAIRVKNDSSKHYSNNLVNKICLKWRKMAIIFNKSSFSAATKVGEIQYSLPSIMTKRQYSPIISTQYKGIGFSFLACPIKNASMSCAMGSPVGFRFAIFFLFCSQKYEKRVGKWK